MKLATGVIFALFLGVAGQQPQQPVDSPPKIATEQPFYVAGYQVRTSNANEMSGHGEIGKLWQRFFQENLGICRA
jgi:hypothetical protein